MAARWSASREDRTTGDLGSTTLSAGANGGKSPDSRARGDLSRETLDQIVEAIRSVVYGQVVILVQDGKVVQIDRTEKVRLR